MRLRPGAESLESRQAGQRASGARQGQVTAKAPAHSGRPRLRDPSTRCRPGAFSDMDDFDRDQLTGVPLIAAARTECFDDLIRSQDSPTINCPRRGDESERLNDGNHRWALRVFVLRQSQLGPLMARTLGHCATVSTVLSPRMTASEAPRPHTVTIRLETRQLGGRLHRDRSWASFPVASRPLRFLTQRLLAIEWLLPLFEPSIVQRHTGLDLEAGSQVNPACGDFTRRIGRAK